MPQIPYVATNNDLGAIATLTAASASGVTANLTNSGCSGVQVRINVTAITGTSPTLTVTVQGYDPASATYFTLLASAAISATGFTTLTIHPGTTAAANSVANTSVPAYWRVSYAIGGTTPAITGTISACTLV